MARPFAGLMLLGLCLSATAFARETAATACSRGWIESYASGTGDTYYGDYEPQRVRDLSALPKAVRAKLLAHLAHRLGPHESTRLRFVKGVKIDRARLLREEPEAADYQWEVPTYDLDFEYSRPDAGVRRFGVSLSLRADGSVIEEVQLPDFVATPARASIAPLELSCGVAARHGFADAERVALDYVPQRDVLVWRFEKAGKNDGVAGTTEHLEIDAHDPTVVNRRESTWIH